jgi:hypothetical protein
MPVKIFFCYAHEDEPLLNILKTHLRPLQRAGLIDVWHDRDISAGTEWEQQIKEQLNSAQIILLLVSPDFMDSNYCYSIEMQRALERHDRGEALVIPVILRHIYWLGAPFGKLQALPKDAKPVKSWPDPDEAFFNVAEGIRKAVEEVMPKHTPPSPDKSSKSARSQFFISYDESNRDWARWIAWHLQQAGRSVVPLEGIAQPSTNVAVEWRDALAQAEHVIAVISPKYLKARSNQGDWTMIFKHDYASEKGKVLPVCVQDCGQPFERLLHTPDYINLIDLNNQAAKEALLDGVREWIQPVFPGGPTLISPVTTLEPPLPLNPPPPKQIEIFVFYSHLDQNFRKYLDKYLSPLKAIYPTTFWYDGVIGPGVNFEQEIEIHLRNAHIILLMVSPDFVDSEYCSVKELGPAMERHHKGEARVIPIILRPTFWKGTPFRKLQALPNNAKPITEWQPRDAGYVKVAEGIEKVIKDMLRKP